ncbi:class I SAM-dependent methyltransferase [Azotosporobacter soli]|uniref:class I SAM-dependent methyltransferase n=1 Tax=Azotosporobacter soli TaxID=3055040 RepID=UPI0031FE8080
MAKLMKIDTENRVCECCGNDVLESLWVNKYNKQRTKSGIWCLPANNVMCTKCGFVFVSPVATAATLDEYYKDSYVHFGGSTMDFEPETRKKALEKVLDKTRKKLSKESSFVEIGCNAHTQFHESIREYFDSIITVEVNSAVDSDYKSIFDLPKGKIDVAAHYFVLEHIPDPRAFLLQCYEVLKKEGILIVEVPDLMLYEQYPASLSLSEHVNHFSRETLNLFCENIGFATVEGEWPCSRGFGFTAVYMKTENKSSSNRAQNIVESNRNCIKKASEKVELFELKMTEAFEQMSAICKRGGKVTLWCANDNLMRFVNGRLLPKEGIEIVDADPCKCDFIEARKTVMPMQLEQHIKNSELLIVFSELNKKAILEYISKAFNKSFSASEIIVLAQ